MKPENKNMLVRGEIAIDYYRNGCLGFDMPDADERNIVYAYTRWYRHDENLEELERSLNKLLECYQRMGRWNGAMRRYTYKPYNNK